MKKLKKTILVIMMTIVLLSAVSTGNLIYGCSVSNPCGAWCQTMGSCGGDEECSNHGSGVVCRCGKVWAGFECDGSWWYGSPQN